MTRRFTLMLLAFFYAALPVAAQTWPTHMVKLIVPFGAGSTPDVIMRLIADHLRAKLGQSFIVENKPGASGNLGTDAVAKAAPDGYTLGLSIGGPLAINPILFGQLPYDPKKDLAFVTTLATQPSALAVNNELGVDSVAALVALLKKNPGKYNFGSIGVGSLSHLAMEAIALESGTQIVHVPYPSSPAAVTALLRNDVQMVCLPAISVTPQAAAGKLKILAVSTAQPSALMPGVPTLKQSGIDVEADAWSGLIAPARTPPAIIATVRAAVVEALDAPDVKAKLAAQIMAPIPSTPEEFRARIDADIARWAPVIKAANIKVN
ncbi:MAG TPA: tripartite tricarboxylate transporter substrate binding protein [Xanthobacteraceae bacterium]|nr:tripartite tricarboxylate transporter substrate binding protein [Xanthobacteraceae bacterium]